MTDEPLTPEEQLVADAKVAAATVPESVPDAADLPDEVKDGDPTSGDEL